MWDSILKLFGKNGASKTLAGKTILIIDDGETERRFISGIIEKQGCRALAAADGKAGIELAKTSRPDLVILDYRMPGLNGKEVCQILKSDENTRKIPVVFLTGSTTPGNVVECYDVGADYYLSKPISAKSLIHQIELTFQEKPLL